MISSSLNSDLYIAYQYSRVIYLFIYLEINVSIAQIIVYLGFYTFKKIVDENQFSICMNKTMTVD